MGKVNRLTVNKCSVWGRGGGRVCMGGEGEGGDWMQKHILNSLCQRHAMNALFFSSQIPCLLTECRVYGSVIN